MEIPKTRSLKSRHKQSLQEWKAISSPKLSKETQVSLLTVYVKSFLDAITNSMF